MAFRRNSAGGTLSGVRIGKLLEQRDAGSLSHLTSVSRRSGVYGLDERHSGGQVHRGKVVSEDRLDRDSRLAGYVAKPRDIDLPDRARVIGGLGNLNRRDFRDEAVSRIVREHDGLHLEKGEGRIRGDGSRQVGSNSAYEEPKWGRSSNYDSYSLEKAGSLRSSDNMSNPIGIAGVIFEAGKRLITECFQKGNFGLPFANRRYAEQVGPGTKVFLFDYDSRELHGIFQAVSYADPSISGATGGPTSQIRVRLIKECAYLSEREFKDIIYTNYDALSKFSAKLSAEQVAKLLQCFRPVTSHTLRNSETGRTLHLPVSASRSSVQVGMQQASDEHHDISAEYVYGKDKKWRRGLVEYVPGNSFENQDASRPSKNWPLANFPSSYKGWSTEMEDRGIDDAIDDISTEDARITASGTHFSTSRIKHQSSQAFSEPKAAAHGTSSGGRIESDYKVEWRAAADHKDLIYRKRRTLDSSHWEDYRERERSFSPMKDIPLRIEALSEETHEKGAYKDERLYLSSRRRQHNDFDLNIPLDPSYGDHVSSHVNDLETKLMRRKVWDDKDYSISSSKGCSVMVRSSTRVTDSIESDVDMDDYEETRPRVSVARKNMSYVHSTEKSRYNSSIGTTDKFTKLQQTRRPISSKFLEDSTALGSSSRNFTVRELGKTHSPSRNVGKFPSVQIQANFRTSGKPERVVKMFKTPRSAGTLIDGRTDKDGFHPWGTVSGDSSLHEGGFSFGQKRKASVWSRISAPKNIHRNKFAASADKGRGLVFSRLGPMLSCYREPRDDTFPRKKRRLWPSGINAHMDSSPEVDGVQGLYESTNNLEDEDNHVDADIGHESFEGEAGKVEESVADRIQSWRRKKTLHATSSGDEACLSDHGDFENQNGPRKNSGRRKLVRPPLGGQLNIEDAKGKKELSFHAEDPSFLSLHQSSNIDGNSTGRRMREEGDSSTPCRNAGIKGNVSYGLSSSVITSQDANANAGSNPSYTEQHFMEHVSRSGSRNSGSTEVGHPDMEADDIMSS